MYLLVIQYSWHRLVYKIIYLSFLSNQNGGIVTSEAVAPVGVSGYKQLYNTLQISVKVYNYYINLIVCAIFVINLSVHL